MEKYIFIALIFALLSYAARVGLTLSNMGLKEHIYAFLGYSLVFALSGLGVNLVNRHSFSKLAGYGVVLHFLVAFGLLLWSLISWKRQSKEKSSYILLLPCPFCLLTLFLSIFYASKILSISIFKLVIVFYIIFVLLLLMFSCLGKILKVTVWEVMFASGLYYLVILLCSRYYRETMDVYKLSINNGLLISLKSLWIACAVFAIFVVGIIRGYRIWLR